MPDHELESTQWVNSSQFPASVRVGPWVDPRAWSAQGLTRTQTDQPNEFAKFSEAASFSLNLAPKMCVLGSMRTLRLTLILTISLLTVGLQAAPGPYVLCVSKCEVAESGETVEMVCWSGPSESGCRIIKAGSAQSGGCCATEEAEVADLGGCCALEEVDLADMGCCVADVSCPPFESCKQFPVDSDQQCPMGSPECFYCLPGRVLADKAPQGEQSNEDIGRYIVESATSQLAVADIARQVSHSHSPPGQVLADSGSDICIEICLLLI